MSLIRCLALFGAALVVPAATAAAPAPSKPKPQKSAAKPSIPKSDKALQDRWKKLSAREAAELTRKHLKAIGIAAHEYHDKHGTFPPAVIDNPKLPAGKRLSGFVLLLPYLDHPNIRKELAPWHDAEVFDEIKDAADSIDLTKAWDDPANLKAAHTLIPMFLSPQQGPYRNRRGFAVTHFAFVSGSSVGLDGSFPGERGVGIPEITDGTSMTLMFGQVADDVGPWIAEGRSTARQVCAPTDSAPGNFSSGYESGCYFVFCDGSVQYMVFGKNDGALLDKLATRAAREPLLPGEFPRGRLPPELHKP